VRIDPRGWIARDPPWLERGCDVLHSHAIVRRMALTERSNMVTVRMSDDERRMLDALALDQGLSASDILRLLVRESFWQKYGVRTPPRKKK
jgi:hypothetical protein